MFDAPTGGNLLLLLPFATSRPQPGNGPVDLVGAEDAAIVLLLDALATCPNGAAWSGSFAAGAVIGSTHDTAAIRGPNSIPTSSGYMPAAIASAPLTGVALVVNRGVLQAGATVVA